MKQKYHEDHNNGAKPSGDLSDNQAVKDTAVKGRDLLKKLDQKQKEKGGRWVYCCGVKTWVKD